MKTEIKAGVLISLSYFLWLLAEFKLGLHSYRIDYYPFVFWLAFILPIAGIYLTIRYARDKEHAGKINFLQSLLSGLKITAVISAVIPLLSWLYVSVINPTYFPAMKAQQENMIEDLNLSSSTEKEALIRELAISYFPASFLFRQFLIILISSIFLSLIIAALIKKEHIPGGTQKNVGHG